MGRKQSYKIITCPKCGRKVRLWADGRRSRHMRNGRERCWGESGKGAEKEERGRGVMKEFTVKTLMYILNTNGGATPEIFIEDFAPIGQKLWDEIFGEEYVELDGNRRILLTNKGMKALRKAVLMAMKKGDKS